MHHGLCRLPVLRRRPQTRPRVPAPDAYVASLESRLHDERLNSAALQDHASAPSADSSSQPPSAYVTQLGIHPRTQVNLELGLEESLVYHSATSIFRDEMVHGRKKASNSSGSAAFDEIGRGSPSKGWGYSGIAFRTAQYLGIQRDPKNWVQHDSSLAAPEDIEILRLIYWGCHISDKLISLVLGRPVYLVHDEAEVQPMETLPEPPEMASWRPVGFFDTESSESTNLSSLILYLHEQIRLSRIIERMISTPFSPRSNLDDIGRRPIPGVLALHLLFHDA
ncbi:putative transcriptional regulatory protein [Colletotrichum orbiculare MAFF 240422]|uniref:Transcriptional regulatory protein n=1 Tax=Colletotrichum orbiculare (strain 104-T / ATCC 96160 / CBS 514.97 / LARS 414 / MAFF 240422) TaxID=1213857 RepID=A0A484FG30_COLOR|nr:putative transcriptional regulatory protein [Colletotrichum orbiculare MAFF 240422]